MNAKRVKRYAIADYLAEDAQGLDFIESFVEIKTTWHPIGVAQVRRFVAILGLAAFVSILPPHRAAADAGQWRHSGPQGYVNFISQDPGPAGTVYATGATVFKSPDYGDTWDLVTTFQIDVLAVDPGNPSVLYGSSSIPERGVFKSSDSGRTWTPSSAGLPPSAWLLLYAAGPGHVFGVDDRGVWETTDAASTWRLISSGMFGISALAIDPTNVRRVYASDQYGYIFRSDDGGTSWIRSPGTAGHSKTSIAVNPLNPAHVFAGVICCNEILISRNFGESWMPVNVPANRVTSVVIDPIGRIFIGTGPGACPGPCPPEPTGVFQSSDGGVNWQSLNQGLGYRSIRHLLVVGKGRRLIALTDGDPGTFLLDLGVTTDVPDLSDLSAFVFVCLLALAGVMAIHAGLPSRP